MPPKRKATSKGKEVSTKRSRTKDATTATSISPHQISSLITDTLFFTDVVSVLFSFLDVRHLLKFVSVSKEFEKRLTYEHVVRAALISGGFPQTSLERMLRPIRERKLWIPSPLRLLRVVCGKRCEICNITPNRYVCESFGVFLCKICLKKSTKLFRSSKLWKPYLEAPGVLLGPRKGPLKLKSYLLVTPMRDRSGNKIGPLVTADDLEAMVVKSKESSSSTKLTPSDMVAAWIKECNAQQPHAESARQTILQAAGDNKNRQDAENRKAVAKRERRKESRRQTKKVRRSHSKVSGAVEESRPRRPRLLT